MRRRSLALALCALLAACAGSGAHPPQRVTWIPLPAVFFTMPDGTRAVPSELLLPVRIDGVAREGWLQFDTGSPASVLYGATLRRSGGAALAARLRSGGVAALHVASLPLRREPVGVERDLDEGDRLGKPLFGVLGAGAALDGAVAIDFVHDRIAFAPHRDLLPADAATTAAVPLRVLPAPHRVLLVDARLGGRTLHDVLYDTGASPFALVVGERAFRAATGRSGDDPRDVVLRTAAFGHENVLRGAPARVAVGVGPLIRRTGVTLYRFPPDSPLNGLGGLLGNGLFLHRALVVIDAPHARLEFGAPSESGGH